MLRVSWRIIGGAVGFAAAVGLLFGVGIPLSNRVLDTLTFPREPDPRVRIVAIDEASLAGVAPWPWPRSLHARLIKRLSDAGARVIVYDADFFQPSDSNEDDDLVAAVRLAGNVILAREKERVPFSRLLDVARAIGEVGVQADRDGVVRRMSWQWVAQDGRRYPSLGYAAATLVGSDAIRWLPERADKTVTLSYPNASGRAFPILSAKDVLDKTRDLSDVRDRVVFVGLSAADGQRSNVEIQATLFDTLVGQRWILPVPFWLQTLFLMALGFFIARLAEKKRGIGLVIRMISVMMGVALLAALLLRFGKALDVVWPWVVIIVSSGLIAAERRIRTKKDFQSRLWRARQQMSRDVAEQWVGASRKEPEECFVTIACCDLAPLWKRLENEPLITQTRAREKLARQWREMVFDERGMIPAGNDHAIVGWWNVPFAQTDAAPRAARVALRAKRFLQDEFGFADAVFTLERKQAVFSVDDEGVARVSYREETMLHDTATRTGVNVIMDAAFKQEIGAGFFSRRIGGLDECGEAFELVGPVAEIHEEDRTRVSLYEQALVSYERHDTSGAAETLTRLLAHFPDDKPARKLLTRCEISRSPSDPAPA